MSETQDKRPKAHFLRWIWHVDPMKEFKRYAENGFVDHRMTAFLCWAPFPPGYVNSEKFYEFSMIGGRGMLPPNPKHTS